MALAGVQSVPNVCEVEVIASPGWESRGYQLLFEVPHGATEELQYQGLREQIDPELPEDLRDFFFVNTDVGSTEYARQVARWIASPDAAVLDLLSPEVLARMDRLSPRRVLLVRCLIPRTFVDTNRIVDPGAPEGMTAAIADYVRRPEDVARLTELHRQYHEVVENAYAEVCGSGGWALMPHSYAPRSVQIGTIDEGIGQALRRAYEPEHYEKWPLRAQVDLITEAAEGEVLAPSQLVADLVQELARAGIDAAQNSTYRLHPATMGYRYSARFPGRVLCMEVRRDLLADPFDPFTEMTIGVEKVNSIARPIAAAFLRQLARG